MGTKMLLTESKAPMYAVPQIVEATDGSGRLKVIFVAQVSDRQNENKRVYGRAIWEKNLAETSRYMRTIAERRACGELEHPESGQTHYSRVSHFITRSWMEEVPATNKYEVPV